MEKANCFILMAQLIKANGKMINKMDMVIFSLLMEINMMVVGKMVSNMGLVLIYL